MDNQATLTVEIDALQKKYRETNDMVTLVVNNLHDLNQEKQTVTDAILELKQSFVITTNEIAAQKLEWIQQKAKEEQDLEDKKNAVQEILDKEQALNALQIQLDQEKLDNQAILNTANEVAESNKREKVANQVILDEAFSVQRSNTEQEIATQQKIEQFKKNMQAFHANVASAIEGM